MASSVSLPSQLNSFDRRRGRSFAAGLIGLYTILAGLLALTWRRWPDVLVDFGRELYVPWRLAEGDVLYTDIAYFNGPLSPYFNAAIFQVFGASLTTMIVTNTILLALLLTTLYTLATRLFHVGTAFITCACFLPLFAFSHTLRIGNYNYICPYSHEMTHGVLLVFFILALLFSKRVGTWWCSLVVGALWGCVFLGKAEIFLAATGMLWFTTLLRVRAAESPVFALLFRSFWIVCGAALPITLFTIFLTRHMPIEDAVQNIMGTWSWIISSSVTDELFYQRVSGFDDPIFNSFVVLRAFGAIAIACLAAGYVERWRDGKEVSAMIFAVAALGGTLFLAGGLFPLLLHGRGLVLVAAMLFIIFAVARWRSHSHSNLALDLSLAWCVLGGLLLAKFPLRPSIAHYGFVLAMPLVLLAIGWCIERLPMLLCPDTGGKTCRAVLGLLLFADVMGMAGMTATNMLQKNVAVGAADDLLLTDAERGGREVADAVRYLREQTDDDASVMVLPEGVMINYMARRASSTRFVNLCPPEVTMYGEANIRQAMSEQPADYIVLVNKDVREYGQESFGVEGYGADVMQWIKVNYVPIEIFGKPFAKSPELGVTIMKRAEISATQVVDRLSR